MGEARRKSVARAFTKRGYEVGKEGEQRQGQNRARPWVVVEEIGELNERTHACVKNENDRSDHSRGWSNEGNRDTAGGRLAGAAGSPLSAGC